MRYLGIDYGKARVGIAISDEEGKIAFPRQVLPADETLSGKICMLLKEENIADVVLGLPEVPEGMDVSVRDEIQSFGEKLGIECNVTVYYVNEMLTTKIAAVHSKVNTDAAAAALILQSFLDRANRV